MRKLPRKQSVLSIRRTQSQLTAQIAAESPKLHLRIREALRRASGVVARRKFAVRTTPAFSRAEGRRPEGVGWNALLDSILSTASAQWFVGTSLACANPCGSSITTKRFPKLRVRFEPKSAKISFFFSGDPFSSSNLAVCAKFRPLASHGTP